MIMVKNLKASTVRPTLVVYSSQEENYQIECTWHVPFIQIRPRRRRRSRHIDLLSQQLSIL